MFGAGGFVTGNNGAGVVDVMEFIKNGFSGNIDDSEMQRQDNHNQQAKPLVFPFPKAGE
jgi:hypothetical protein